MADFGGRVASGEAVDKELAASRAGSRAGERLELQSEFFGVVGEGRELSLAQHYAAAVGFGRRADATQFILYDDDLRFSADRQSGVQNLRARNREVVLLCRQRILWR